ncbi:hypothetical protein [Clavibacter michiganensis]|uniref:hypothetical protein n=1 Tax=Clavibacter michiganensis TaxID=28447 RepID=UPI000A382810|nr:hypothetical protein [Clavibacter michiganensis]OUE12943.1 hypothetical protein CMMCAY01_08060 [Clavibacter michiganensis subsp. michiganensis]
MHALTTTILAETEHAMELAAPLWVFPAVAGGRVPRARVVMFSFRDVANRHSEKWGKPPVAEQGHGTADSTH